MKSIILLSAALMACPLFPFAQSADEAAIKELVSKETDAFVRKDSSLWKSLFILDSLTTAVYVSGGITFAYTGWTNMEPLYMDYFRYEGGKSDKDLKWVDSNYIIYTSGDLATVEFDQSKKWKPADSAVTSHEGRTMRKRDGLWKIVALRTVSLSSFTSGDSVVIEDHVNSLGYQMLNAGRFKAAIDVFAINVKYSPRSWNVYDSMGEAYMKSGNKPLARKNYETSLKLNPKNDNGKAMLATLREK